VLLFLYQPPAASLDLDRSRNQPHIHPQDYHHYHHHYYYHPQRRSSV